MARRYGQDDSDAPTPRNDVYTGLLAVSFFAMLTGCLLLILDWYSYPDAPPKSVSVVPGSGGPKPAPKRAQPPEAKKEEEPKKVVEPEKKEEMKKEEMKKDPEKKEEMKKEEMKKDAEKKEEKKE